MGWLAKRVPGSRESEVAPPVRACLNVPPFWGVAAITFPDKRVGDTAAASPNAETSAINCLREIFLLLYIRCNSDRLDIFSSSLDCGVVY